MSNNSNEMEDILNKTFTLAKMQRHILITPETLLYTIIFTNLGRSFLIESGGDINGLKTDLEIYLMEKIPCFDSDSDKNHSSITTEFSSLLREAQVFAASFQRSKFILDDVFLSYYKIKTPSTIFLEKNGFREDNVKKIIFNKISKRQLQTANNQEDEDDLSFLVNLNEKVSQNSLDPLIGREDEIQRVIQILSRKKKNNPLLVGEPGVGKTSIAEGIAKLILEDKVDESMKNHIIWSLDLGGMLAGTKFRGEFEQRLKKVIDKLKKEKNAVLFIDEIHTLIGAGSAGEKGSLDAANILKPELASGEIKCIGATTYKEFRNNFEKDSALARRFQKVEIDEPNKENTLKIINGLKKHYEDFHKVVYTDESLVHLVNFADKYINDRHFPDKAIDLMDEAGSLAKLSKINIVNNSLVDKILTKVAKIPEKIISTDQKSILKNLQGSLESLIFGQNEAIFKVVDSILLNKAGIRTGSKPIGSFLFCGPTGVGKTELCLQLSNQLGLDLLRLDMSEYMEKGSISKLIGTAPGYVGFDQEGVLTSFVVKKPNSIILIDEIEKSHKDIWNLLLQIMDNGFILDNFGKKIDFRNTIIIITSNVGSHTITEKSIGLGFDEVIEKPTKEIENTFSPEFRNRLSSIIWFNPLSKENIKSILEKYLNELDVVLLKKGIILSYKDSAKQWLISNGFSTSMGARPMKRLVEEKISIPLSKEILFGNLENGGNVSIEEKNGSLVFDFKKSRKKEKV